MQTDPSATHKFQRLCLLEPFLLAVIRTTKPPEVRLSVEHTILFQIFKNQRLAENWKIFDSTFIPDRGYENTKNISLEFSDCFKDTSAYNINADFHKPRETKYGDGSQNHTRSIP